MSNISTMIKCPQCQKNHVYDTNNTFRPFCSERCKLMDFNEWASDGYAIASEENKLETMSNDIDQE